jgi:hypothetical protein
MGKAKNANRPLTQEEIWDDSALVQSWDEAVEEYKVRFLYLSRDLYLTQLQQLYHSIHAKGENVEDVLREAEAAERAALDQDGQKPDEALDAMEDDDAAAATASAKAEQSSSMQVPDVSRLLVGSASELVFVTLFRQQRSTRQRLISSRPGRSIQLSLLPWEQLRCHMLL